MEARVHAIRHANADECIWLLEHPPLYTAGTSANAQDLLDTQDFPVYQTGRGGQYTYHGPGQRVAYVMLDLKQRLGPAPDVRRFVWLLEEWLIRTLQRFDVEGERREGRIGIWALRLMCIRIYRIIPGSCPAVFRNSGSRRSPRSEKTPRWQKSTQR